jgi:hypothetical protein
MSLNKEDKADVSRSMGKALANKVSKVTKDYGVKTNYPKRDIHVNGKYEATTTWARTNREAKEKFLEKNPHHTSSKLFVSKQK